MNARPLALVLIAIVWAAAPVVAQVAPSPNLPPLLLVAEGLDADALRAQLSERAHVEVHGMQEAPLETLDVHVLVTVAGAEIRIWVMVAGAVDIHLVQAGPDPVTAASEYLARVLNERAVLERATEAEIARTSTGVINPFDRVERSAVSSEIIDPWRYNRIRERPSALTAPPPGARN